MNGEGILSSCVPVSRPYLAASPYHVPFDDRGRIVEQAGLAPSDGKPYPPTTIKFDDKGRRTEIVFRSFSGDVNGSHVMTWDADGLGAKLVVNDAQNSERKNVIRDTGDLTFDAQDRVTRIKYNQAGGGSRYFFYNYAPEGRLDSILTATKPDPAEATAKVTYKYNDKGFVAEEEQFRGQLKFGPPGTADTFEWKPAQKMEYTYEYDAQGNWVKRTSTYTNAASNAAPKPYFLTLRTIEYAE